jgi:hypothetical protein
MPPKKSNLQVVPRKPHAAGHREPRSKHAKTELVSGRWLLAALGVTVGAAIACGWLVLCLLFWQGSWQLLYHPSATVTKTPASAGLSFDRVAFAVTDAGVPQLKGWWIPAAPGSDRGRLTVLVLHGQDGNLGDTVDTLALLHEAGVNVFAFDYRGYGESQFVRPSEQTWRLDAEWAIKYLTSERQIGAGTIVLFGNRLGADLALEVAAQHPELAGVVADAPIADPASAIFNDARARMVPARLLVHDRYDQGAAASAVRVPVLWLERTDATGSPKEPQAYEGVASHKMLVWVDPAGNVYDQTENALSRWLDGLAAR